MQFVFDRPAAPAFSQGTLVSYVIPHASALELTGRLNGIVLSRKAYNAVDGRPLICPIIYGDHPVNEELGIRIPTGSHIPSYLRPDLSTIIAVSYGKVRAYAHGRDRKAVLFPRELTKAAYSSLLGIIQPTQYKLSVIGQGFLGYGQIGYAQSFPRRTELLLEPAPVLCLTPPEIYTKTGTALAVRAYSHLERYDSRFHVMLDDHKWFQRGFFSVDDLTVISVKGTLASKNGRKAIEAGMRAMKGIFRKSAAIFDEAAYEGVVERYNHPVGHIPHRMLNGHTTIPQRTIRHDQPVPAG